MKKHFIFQKSDRFATEKELICTVTGAKNKKQAIEACEAYFNLDPDALEAFFGVTVKAEAKAFSPEFGLWATV